MEFSICYPEDRNKLAETLAELLFLYLTETHFPINSLILF